MNNLPEVIMSSDTMYDVKLNGKNLAGTPVVLTTVLVTSKNYTPVFCEHFRWEFSADREEDSTNMAEVVYPIKWHLIGFNPCQLARVKPY